MPRPVSGPSGVRPADGADVGWVPASRTRRWAVAELVTGGVLLAAVAGGGLAIAQHPGVTALDRRGFALVPPSTDRLFADLTGLRYPVIVVIASAVVATVVVTRDRARAAACLVGPPLALLVAELAKPATGRTLEGALSYPSGTTAGAAALATAVVLVTAPGWRPVVAVLGAVYVGWTAVAVVALRWHYPTDALAGVGMGIGLMLSVDGLAWAVAARMEPDRSR